MESHIASDANHKTIFGMEWEGTRNEGLFGAVQSQLGMVVPLIFMELFLGFSAFIRAVFFVFRLGWKVTVPTFHFNVYIYIWPGGAKNDDERFFFQKKKEIEGKNDFQRINWHIASMQSEVDRDSDYRLNTERYDKQIAIFSFKSRIRRNPVETLHNCYCEA